MSFNVLADYPRWAPAWKLRCPIAAGILRYHQPDLVGGQEFRRHQLDDLAAALPEFAWLGAGRDDGKEAGEFVPILYRRDRFEVWESGTFWLSATPGVPGKGWDAKCVRIVTWARFHDRAGGRSFVHLNTHFDHLGRQARRESARLLLQRAEALAPEGPVIVTGDLNCLENSTAYAILTGPASAERSRIVLRDTLRCCEFPPLGPRKTWGGFLPGNLTSARLDYIFVGGRVHVRQHAVLTDQGHDGRYPSDHRPVVAELEFAGPDGT